jgi:CRISPR-associated protein Cmr4
MYWIHALEPLHVGAGRGVGFIDLPIMRETATNWPFAPGTSFKGVLADSHRATDGARANDAKLALAFGRADDKQANQGGAQAGRLMFTDARLVAFPVRSLYGTFAWVTCPLALARLHRDLSRRGLANGLSPSLAVNANATSQALPLNVADLAMTTLAVSTPAQQQQQQQQLKAYLGELDFDIAQNPDLATWADHIATQAFADQNWQTLFRERFCLVADDVFTWLTEFETQVDARVKISDETKTVANGQLWYEESLPPETILAGSVVCDRILPRQNSASSVTEEQLLNEYCSGSRVLQMGGKSSVGRGVIELRFSGSANSQSISALGATTPNSPAAPDSTPPASGPIPSNQEAP